VFNLPNFILKIWQQYKYPRKFRTFLEFSRPPQEESDGCDLFFSLHVFE
jgi:hypothetical protein